MDIDTIEAELRSAGELHIVVEEHEHVSGDEEYIGLRSGNTSFDDDCGVIYIDDGKKTHMIDADRVIYASQAIEFPD